MNTKKSLAALLLMVATPLALAETDKAPAGAELFKQRTCAACHAEKTKTVGPSLEQLRSKHAQATAEEIQLLVVKAKSGGSGVWGPIPMPPQPHVSEEDLQKIVAWMVTPP